MSRRAKGPRLHLRQRAGRAAVYVILDRGVETNTGFGVEELGQAEEALGDYLSRKRLTSLRKCDPAAVTIDEVLAFYTDGKADELARPDMVASIVPLLLAHAGDDTCAVINGDWCRAYIKKRTSGKIAPPLQKGKKGLKLPKASSVRRDLQHLSACLGYAVKEGLLAYAPRITYPAQPDARMRFMTRDEVAKLLWTCWRYKQRGPKNQTLYPLRHLCRFILIGIYTGTRSTAILTSSFTAGAGRSYIDVPAGVFYRLAEGKRATKKLQPPVALPDRLLAHLRRWQRKTNTGWVVTFHGEPVISVKKGFTNAVRKAGLIGVTAHTMRHTFMTWVLQNGMAIHTASKIAGMSVKTADSTYGHLDSTRRDGLNDAIRGPVMGRTRTSMMRRA